MYVWYNTFMSKKGYRLKEETKEKIRLAMTGENNPFYGRTHTEESKAKIRIKKIGLYPSEETIEKIREATKGKNNPFYGKKHSSEAREKISASAKKRQASKETCLAISESHLGIKNHMYGKHHTKKANEQNRIAHIGKKASIETRRKMSKKHKIVWSQSIEYKNRRVGSIVRGNKKKPNSKEIAILKILDEIQPDTWAFIGDGKKQINGIGGKMPDFSNGDHKIIEHYGKYWHRHHDPQERIDLFAQYGYKTLIIQEVELMKEPDKVKARIAEFCTTTP